MSNDAQNSASGQNGSQDDSLGRAANRYVSFQIASAIIGGILFLIFLFAVILPGMNRVNQGMSQNGLAPGTTMAPGGSGTATYSVDGKPATPDQQRSIDAAISQSHASGQPPK